MSNEEPVVTSSAPSKKKRFISWGGIGILLSGLSFIVLIGVASLAYHQLITINIQLANKVNDLNDKTNQLTEELNQKSTQLEETLKASTSSDVTQWKWAQVSYFVKLADAYLQLEHNAPFAITLLNFANEDLNGLEDTQSENIKSALNEDIAQLKNVVPPDNQTLFSRLSALHVVIDRLPLLHQAFPQKEISIPKEESMSWWKQGLKETWQGLQHIVVVRSDAKETLPFVSPEEEKYLRQNLHSLLFQATWGLLHQNEFIYRASLQQSEAWAKQYFDDDNAEVLSFLHELADLQKVAIEPVMPTLSHSLEVLQTINHP